MQAIQAWLKAHPVRSSVGAGLLLAIGLVGATAQTFPSRDFGGPSGRDLVTGYLCVTPGCDVVRLPQSDCICKKENPEEMRLSKLKLTCSTKERGEWVSCPVKSPYGN